MPVPFGRMREFENRRVRMVFDDGLETIARLLSAVEDLDGEHHLIYDSVEWANDPREAGSAQDSTVYAEGESLVSIEAMEDGSEMRAEETPGGILSAEAADPAVRMASVMGLADRIFGSHEEALLWLRSADDRLGDKTPLSLLQTESGGRLVEALLWRIDEGVYG